MGNEGKIISSVLPALWESFTLLSHKTGVRRNLGISHMSCEVIFIVFKSSSQRPDLGQLWLWCLSVAASQQVSHQSLVLAHGP